MDFIIEYRKDSPTTSIIALLLHHRKFQDTKDFAQRLTSLLRLTPQSKAVLPQEAPSAEDTAHVALVEILQKIKAIKAQARHSRARFKPCQHHLRIGILTPRCTDGQCCDPNHPKN